MSAVEFKPWPKIARLNRNYTISEKIDGTNACVIVHEDGSVHAQSRNRIITQDADNFGFAKWVDANALELRDGLGEGYHYGEWWGLGIQRGYGLTERRFSLFNTGRWMDEHTSNPEDTPGEYAPTCCHVVPILTQSNGAMDADAYECILDLARNGSAAAPGFKPAEGIVIYHAASRQLFKVTIDGDDTHKGVAS